MVSVNTPLLLVEPPTGSYPRTLLHPGTIYEPYLAETLLTRLEHRERRLYCPTLLTLLTAY